MAPAKKAKRGASRKAAPKKTAKKTAASARPKSVKLTMRKKGVFTNLDLVDNVMAWNPEMKKAAARQVVDDVLTTLHSAIKNADKVRLKGIGTITKKKIPAKKGGQLVKNPFTGEMVKSKAKPASVRVKLSAAKELKKF